MLPVIIFAGLIYAIQIELVKQEDPTFSASEIQGKILKYEKESKIRLENFCKDFDTVRLIPGTSSGDYRAIIKENKELVLFVYQKDSLVFWNSNKVPLPNNFTRNFSQFTFVMKLQNGWYHFQVKRFGSFTGVGCFLIKNEFPFENDYLNNEFSGKISLPSSFSITSTRKGVPIYSESGVILFSLKNDQTQQYVSGKPPVFAFLFFIVGSIFFLLFIYHINLNIPGLINHKGVMVLVFSLEAILLRLFQYYWKVPKLLFNSELFAPTWYASSSTIPSLGDFVINVLFLCIIIAVLYKNRNVIRVSWFSRARNNILLAFIATILLFISFSVMVSLIDNLVINSSIPLNLQNIGALNSQSGFGFFIISGLVFAFWFFSISILSILIPTQNRLKEIIAGSLIGLLSCLLFAGLTGWEENIDRLLFFMIYQVILYFLWIKKRPLNTLQSSLFFLCFFSILATSVLNHSNQNKEHEKRKLFAMKLMTHRNPLTEALFEQLDRKLISDTIIRQILVKNPDVSDNIQDLLKKYLTDKYFHNYWTKFNLQVTLCNKTKNLKIQPQGFLIGCHDYFQGIIRNNGEATTSPHLYFIDYGFGSENYLVVIPGIGTKDNTIDGRTLYMELSTKTAFKDLGYPELLIDKSNLSPPELSEYSYAVYEKGRLVHSVGSYNYRLELNPYLIHKTLTFFSYDKYDHYYYRINNTTVLLISKKQTSIFSKIAPFPYLIILFSFITLVITGIVKRKYLFPFSPGSLRERLQLSMIGILILTFLVIGLVLINNIININKKKNESGLQEKAFSVLVEIQHKYGGISGWQTQTTADLKDFFVKLSNVFFTDINFYNSSGILIATSRPQIFEEGLLSYLMDADAYRKLIAEKRSILVHDEVIGTLNYSSAYLPVMNDQNQLLGYVNLPYFSREDELKKEISTTLVTFTNIYILLILLGIAVAWGLSKYITAPLAMLASTMSNLRFGKNNEKINWKKEDEIGQLVKEYNRMVEALSKSAEKLARSERESAWREMARQVAHEIKNPLTPMKLNIQYLQKAWQDKAPDWDHRLNQFSKILIEQINTLSDIASEFSDFAQMPRVNPEVIDLEQLIPSVLAQYENSSKIEFSFSVVSGHPFVFGDRKQLVRVFINLINNSIQALVERDHGNIAITVHDEKNNLVIQIKDDGCGIPQDQTTLIFQPNFTTKTSGMGLGLAIVKGILENMNGSIDFTSEENIGTTFTIKLPRNVEKG